MAKSGVAGTSAGALSGYRAVWLIVLCDLPVGTKSERKAATGFRNTLLDLGFAMSQFSVYLKACADLPLLTGPV